MWQCTLVRRHNLMTSLMALSSILAGRLARKVWYLFSSPLTFYAWKHILQSIFKINHWIKSDFDTTVTAGGISNSAWNKSTVFRPLISCKACNAWSSVTHGNSCTPDSIKKHLKPLTPFSIKGLSSDLLRGTTPPQKATSTNVLLLAASSLVSKLATVVVGGIEFKGISTIQVIPDAAAAWVAVANPILYGNGVHNDW